VGKGVLFFGGGGHARNQYGAANGGGKCDVSEPMSKHDFSPQSPGRRSDHVGQNATAPQNSVAIIDQERLNSFCFPVP
jgi:hypothetical protein